MTTINVGMMQKNYEERCRLGMFGGASYDLWRNGGDRRGERNHVRTIQDRLSFDLTLVMKILVSPEDKKNAFGRFFSLCPPFSSCK